MMIMVKDALHAASLYQRLAQQCLNAQCAVRERLVDVLSAVTKAYRMYVGHVAFRVHEVMLLWVK